MVGPGSPKPVTGVRFPPDLHHGIDSTLVMASENNFLLNNERINAFPFSALSLRLQELGFREFVKPNHKIITIPKDISCELPKPTDLEINGISVCTTTEEELSSRVITLPLDAWNLDNFEPNVFRKNGIYQFNFIIEAENYYLKLISHDPSFPRDSLCFSINKQQIILLPIVISNY